LRPSLNEIIDSYIPNRLPKQYKDKPIVICLCFGGDIQEQVRPQVEGYIEANTKNGITFEEWNGDKLAELILSNFLREDLLPPEARSMLRKSLALLDEPDVSYKHFLRLVKMLTNVDDKKASDIVRAIRQLNISLWILFSWCRESNNLEAAYLASELTLLHAWDMSKSYMGKKSKVAKEIHQTLVAIQNLNYQVSVLYIDSKILPHTDKLYALSNAVNPSCNVDVNLKLFDVLSRLSLTGLWLRWYIHQIPEENIELQRQATDGLHQYQLAVKQLINNNLILLTPYKDDQAIDITIAFCFLASDPSNKEYIYNWLLELIQRARFIFITHGRYSCNLHTYHELIEHPLEKTDSYREEVTAGSILYPYIAIFSALLGFNDVYAEIQTFKSKSLSHCNFQVWYPDETSEDNLYNNGTNHGAILSDACIDKNQDEFLDQVFKECHETNNFTELTAIKLGMWPIVLLACRHYRIPVPVHFLEELRIPPLETSNTDLNTVSDSE